MQVGKPIHAVSRGRWRNHEAAFGEFIAAVGVVDAVFSDGATFSASLSRR